MPKESRFPLYKTPQDGDGTLDEFFELTRSYSQARGLPTDEVQDSWAFTPQSPDLAIALLKFTIHIISEVEFWVSRPRIRELAILAANKELRVEYAYAAHLLAARAEGVTDAQIAMLDFAATNWENVFDDEEQMVVAFTRAAIQGDIPDDLFEQAREMYGNKGVFELTMIIGLYALWGVLINTAGVHIDLVDPVTREYAVHA
jgi:4-carboxymuconolactone decarboxylase